MELPNVNAHFAASTVAAILVHASATAATRSCANAACCCEATGAAIAAERAGATA